MEAQEDDKPPTLKSELLVPHEEAIMAIKREVENSFLLKNSVQFFKITSVRLIDNPHLLNRYNDKKMELHQLQCVARGFDVKEKFVFCEIAENELSDICENGLSVGNCKTCLANPVKGVCVQKHADVLYLEPLSSLKTGTFLMLKMITARNRLVDVEVLNVMNDPPKGYDCLMPSKKIPKDCAPENAYYLSQVFLYEYGGDDNIVKNPRHVLPVAIIKYVYDTSKPFENCVILQLERYHLWKGRLFNGDTMLGSADIMCFTKNIHPPVIPPKLVIASTVTWENLTRNYFSSFKHLNIDKETIVPKVPVQYLLYLELVIKNKSQHLTAFVSELRNQKMAAVMELSNFKGLLIPPNTPLKLGLPKCSRRSLHLILISRSSLQWDRQLTREMRSRILRSLWRKHELHSKESLYHDMIATSVNSSDPRLNGKPDKSAKVDEELLVSFEKICDGPHLHFKNVVNEFKRQFIENEKCHQHLVEAQGLKILSESQCIKTEIDSVSHTMQSSGFLTASNSSLDLSVEQHFDKTCENIVDSCNSQSNVDFMGIAQNNNSISSLRSGSFERMEENDSFVINSSAKENNEHVAEKTKTVGNRDNCSAQRNHWKHDTVQQAPNCNELSDSSLRSLALHKTDSLESTESSPNDSNGEISPTFENILPNLTFIDNQCFKTVAASFKSNSASTVLLKSAVDKVSPSENSDKTISKKILKSKVPDVVMDATKFLHDLITSTYAQYKKTVLGSPQINNLQRMKPCSVETSSTGDIPLPSSALSSLESDPKTAIPPLPSSSPLRLSLPKNTPFRPLLPKDTPVRPLPKDTPVRAPLPQESPVWPPLPKDTPVSPPLPQDFPVRPPLPKDSPVRPPFPNDPPFCTENNANTDGFVNLPKYSAVGIMKSCNSTSNLISSSTTSPRAFQEEGQCKPTQTTNNLCVSPSSQKYSDDKMDLSPISPSLKSCIEVFQSEKPLQIAASESQRSQAPMSTSHFSTSLLTNNFNHPPPTLPNRWGPPPSLTVQNGYCNGREIRAPCSLPMNFNTLNSDVNRTPQFRQPISLNNTGFPNSHVPTTSWHHGPPTPTWQLPFCYPNSNSQCPPFPLPHFSIPVYSNQTHLGHNNAVRPSLPTAINNTIHVSSSSAIPNVTVMSGVHVPPNASSQNFSTTFERCNSRDEKNVVRPFEENRILRTDNEIHKSSNSLSCTSVIDNSKSNVANSLVIEKSDKIGHKGETQKQLSDRMSDIPHSYNMPSSSLTGTSSSCIGRSVDHVPTTDRALSKESDKLVGCDRRSSFLSKPTVNCPLSSLSEQIDVTLMKDHHVQHCQPNVLMSSKCSSTPAPQVPLTNLSCKAHGGKNPLKSNIYPSLKHNPTLIISNNSTCVLPEKGEQGLPNMNGKKRKLSNIQKCSDRQSQIVSKSVPAISSKPLSKQHGNCQVKVIHRQQKGKNTSLNKPGHNANISKSFVGSNNSSISEGCVMSNTVKSDKIEDQACNKVLGKHNLSVGVSNCSITDTCSQQSKEMHANSTSPNVETNEVSNERSKENKYDNLDGPVTKPSQKSNILLGKSQISQDALNSAVGVPGSLSSSKNGEPSLKARTNTNVGIQISTGVTGSLISTLGVPGSSLKEICEESSLQMNTASAQSHKSRITDIDHTNKVSKKSSNSLPGMSDRCTAASNSVNVPQEKYGKVNINDSGQHIETRITSYVRCPSHCGKVTERTLLPVNTTPINCQGISPQDVSSTELNVVKLNSDVSHSCLSSPTEKHSGNAELEIAANKQRSSTERVDNFSTVCRLNSSCQETSQNVDQVSRESININQCSENMVTPLVELLHSNVQSKYVSDSFSSSKQKTCINDGLNVKEIRLYDETISAGVPRMLNNQITSNDCLMSTGNKTDFINIKSNVTSADDRIRSPINNLRSPESLPQLSNGTDKENSLSITQTMKNRIKMEPTDVLHDDSQQEFRMESNSSHINDNTGISKRKLNFQGSLDMQRQIRSTSLEQVTCSQLRSPARNCFTVCANNGIVEKQPENNGTNEIRIKEEIIDNENDGTNMTVCSNQGVNTDDSTWEDSSNGSTASYKSSPPLKKIKIKDEPSDESTTTWDFDSDNFKRESADTTLQLPQLPGPSQHEERKGMWTNLLTKSSCTRELLVFLETLANSVLISDQIPLTDSQICEKFMETNVNIYDLLEVLRLLHDSYYPQGN